MGNPYGEFAFACASARYRKLDPLALSAIATVAVAILSSSLPALLRATGSPNWLPTHIPTR
jgi:hypothetical protein